MLVGLSLNAIRLLKINNVKCDGQKSKNNKCDGQSVQLLISEPSITLIAVYWGTLPKVSYRLKYQDVAMDNCTVVTDIVTDMY